MGEAVWYPGWVPGKFKYRCEEVFPGWWDAQLPTRVPDTADAQQLIKDIIAFTDGKSSSPFRERPDDEHRLVDAELPVIFDRENALAQVRRVIAGNDPEIAPAQILTFDDYFAVELDYAERCTGSWGCVLIDRRVPYMKTCYLYYPQDALLRGAREIQLLAPPMWIEKLSSNGAPDIALLLAEYVLNPCSPAVLRTIASWLIAQDIESESLTLLAEGADGRALADWPALFDAGIEEGGLVVPGRLEAAEYMILYWLRAAIEGGSNMMEEVPVSRCVPIWQEVVDGLPHWRESGLEELMTLRWEYEQIPEYPVIDGWTPECDEERARLERELVEGCREILARQRAARRQ